MFPGFVAVVAFIVLCMVGLGVARWRRHERVSDQVVVAREQRRNRQHHRGSLDMELEPSHRRPPDRPTTPSPSD